MRSVPQDSHRAGPQPFLYDRLPVFDSFDRVGEVSVYAPLPHDWQVGVTDVVDSSRAIDAGRYKEVNLAGAAIVAAIKNALGGAAFPFVFGGDGTTFAVPPEAAEPARRALGATANYVAEELGLELRAGMIPVSEIRAAGHDMRVARYAASDEAVYAMFSGGGARYTEEELKAGRLDFPAVKGARPDLTGLSCRFAPVDSRHGVILSIVVMPSDSATSDAFWKVAGQVIAIVRDFEERSGHPLSAEGPHLPFSPPAIRYEAGATRRFPGNYVFTWARVHLEEFVGAILGRTGGKLGPLDVRKYRTWVARNADFRKFDDALKMTVDCTGGTAQRIRKLLEDAEAGGIVNFGLFAQDSALVTCLVPSVLKDDHLHFLDGAGGGYARASIDLKRRMAERNP